MLSLIFDTETGGIPHNHLPLDHAHQPHLVQLAMCLYEDTVEKASISLIIKPEGWTIPAEAAKVHGITTEIALRLGVPLQLAVASYLNLRALANELVAHNAPFDLKILEIALLRTGRKPSHPGPGKVTCTCEMASPIVNLPPTPKMVAAGINKPKAPKLEEAYKHFFGEELVGAHDAMIDVRACARILFHMRALEAQTL